MQGYGEGRQHIGETVCQSDVISAWRGIATGVIVSQKQSRSAHIQCFADNVSKRQFDKFPALVGADRCPQNLIMEANVNHDKMFVFGIVKLYPEFTEIVFFADRF